MRQHVTFDVLSHTSEGLPNQSATRIKAGTFTAATPHIKGGKVIPIAQKRAKRSRAYPDVPTMQEQGFPTFETMNWYGISGPANLPVALARRINADVNNVLAMPYVVR